MLRIKGIMTRSLRWHKFSEHQPQDNCLVIIFRPLRKKHGIARRTQLTDHEDNGGKTKDHWVTEHGSCHEIQPDDLWFPFPNIIVEQSIRPDEI